MLFSEAVEVFEQVGQTRKRNEITQLMSDLFTKAGKDLKSLVYLIQGVLAPDYEGVEIGLSDKTIIKGFADISGIDENQITGMFHKTGDLGTLAEELLKNKKQMSLETSDLTVTEIREKLLAISKASGKGSSTLRLNLFKEILLNASPLESKYVCRIITGKLRLGASYITILAGLSQAFNYEDSDQVEIAYNFHPDIGLIAKMLQDGNTNELKEIGPEPGVPIKVMLAERLPGIEQILTKMGGSAAFEYKYDGIRAQIHKMGDKVVIYSRGTENQTAQFPDIVASVRNTFQADTCILDGEAVPVNPETGEIYPFQAVSQRRGRKHDLDSAMQEIPLVVFLFDILYLNGESLVNKSYLERRGHLDSLFVENSSFKRASQIVSSSVEEITTFFNSSIENGCEGVVAKNVSEKSIYRAGARGWLWIKMKRDYQVSLADTLDLVIVGAFAGHGRRKGTYGALLMASYNKGRDVFETVCKLGTGFTDDILFALPNRLSDVLSNEKPINVDSKMEPDFWFSPSRVLEVAGAEITLSPVHTCAIGVVREDSGIAVRFPRFTGRFRDDRIAYEATTTHEILELYLGQKKKTSSDKNQTDA